MENTVIGAAAAEVAAPQFEDIVKALEGASDISHEAVVMESQSKGLKPVCEDCGNHDVDIKNTVGFKAFLRAFGPMQEDMPMGVNAEKTSPEGFELEGEHCAAAGQFYETKEFDLRGFCKICCQTKKLVFDDAGVEMQQGNCFGMSKRTTPYNKIDAMGYEDVNIYQLACPPKIRIQRFNCGYRMAGPWAPPCFDEVIEDKFISNAGDDAVEKAYIELRKRAQVASFYDRHEGVPKNMSTVDEAHGVTGNFKINDFSYEYHRKKCCPQGLGVAVTNTRIAQMVETTEQISMKKDMFCEVLEIPGFMRKVWPRCCGGSTDAIYDGIRSRVGATHVRSDLEEKEYNLHACCASTKLRLTNRVIEYEQSCLCNVEKSALTYNSVYQVGKNKDCCVVPMCPCIPISAISIANRENLLMPTALCFAPSQNGMAEEIYQEIRNRIASPLPNSPMKAGMIAPNQQQMQ